jgi:predicted amidophosphoribosyltransferase
MLDAMAGLADLLVGRSCAGCGADAALLCAACGQLLSRPARPAALRPAPPGLPPVFAVADYDGPVRSVLLEHKESARLALAGPLGRALAHSVLEAARTSHARSSPAVLMVPAPSQSAQVRARGHDHARRVARRAAAALRSTGVDAQVVPALRLMRPVSDQSALGAAERMANLSGAVAVTRRWAPRVTRMTKDPRSVVVVDDLVTTGATLLACVLALRACDLEVAGCAVVATTVRRSRGK